jgi:hypothetical protein
MGRSRRQHRDRGRWRRHSAPAHRCLSVGPTPGFADQIYLLLEANTWGVTLNGSEEARFDHLNMLPTP